MDVSEIIECSNCGAHFLNSHTHCLRCGQAASAIAPVAVGGAVAPVAMAATPNFGNSGNGVGQPIYQANPPPALLLPAMAHTAPPAPILPAMPHNSSPPATAARPFNFLWVLLPCLLIAAVVLAAVATGWGPFQPTPDSSPVAVINPAVTPTLQKDTTAIAATPSPTQAVGNLATIAPVSTTAPAINSQAVTTKVASSTTASPTTLATTNARPTTLVTTSPANTTAVSDTPAPSPTTAQSLTTLKNQTNTINSLAFSPGLDGKYLASASFDHTIQIWDWQTKTALQQLKDHKAEVYAVAFSPDGKYLASGSKDKTVKLWDVEQGFKLVSSYDAKAVVITLAFAPKASTLTLAIGTSGSKNLTVLDLTNPNAPVEVKSWTGPSSPVQNLTFSPDGHFLATGSSGGSVLLWDATKTDYPNLNKPGPDGKGVETLAFSPDGQMLAIGRDDNSLTLWDMTTKKLVSLKGHSGIVNAVAFSPDGKTLASVSADKSVKVWDVATATLKDTLSTLKAALLVKAVAFSPDGKFLVSGNSDDGSISVWPLG